MCMSMCVSFQHPMCMGTGMGVIFEIEYECEYNSTCTEPAQLSFLSVTFLPIITPIFFMT